MRQPDEKPWAEDNWVETTSRLPVAFAQVREDPLVDAALVRRLGRPPRVLMIASGGETAALLATLPLQRLHLVDMNPAQLALTRVKLRLLQSVEPQQRLRILGYHPLPAEQRETIIQAILADLHLPGDALGPPQWIAKYGPDYCGRYEWIFARLRTILTDQTDALEQLMLLDDPVAQARLLQSQTSLSEVLAAAFEQTMELSTLVRIFGSEATANRCQPFADHFRKQTQTALAALPARENPFLHQIFLGKFIGSPWPWLEAPTHTSLPETRYTQAKMVDALESLADQSYDLIHLSNILDWVQPAEAQRLLDHTYRCLSHGGLVVIRQLNSRLPIRDLPSGIDWDETASAQLHQADRSFFYRSLHVGAKP